MVGSADEAVELGAVGVSVHVNMGNEHEPEMLCDLGDMYTQCRRLGLPLLEMAYVRHHEGATVVNVTDAVQIAHAARVAAELFATVVKVCYTGDVESFATVTGGCPVPVVIAGGAHNTEATDESAVLSMIRDAGRGGGAGMSMGRNIFQHPDTPSMLKKVQHAVYSVGSTGRRALAVR